MTENPNPLDLIDVDMIVRERIVPYTAETVRRYFRKGILFPHERRNGITFLSYRGSAQVRYKTMNRVARQGLQRMSLDAVGVLFLKAGGADDEFIMDRLKNNQSVTEVTEEFVKKVKELIP